ncbi:MAG: HAMP domain-containing histidine kinase [Myxococcota bacterium]|nr:HAMP domain-containing histidine kinase [Myxococcota bacterium]
MVLVKDPAIGVLLPAPGFSQTLAGGAGWHQLLEALLRPGLHPGRVATPEGAEVSALALALEGGTAFVFLGGVPRPDFLEESRPELTLAAAVLEAEHRARVAEGEAAAAREAARHANGLTSALDLARGELEASLQDRERLIGIVGHDLRNPLQAITMGVSTVLRRGGLTDVHVRSLHRVQTSAIRMSRMIAGLLDFERARAGTLVAQRVPGRLVDLVAAVAEEFEESHPDRPITFRRLADGEGEWAPDRISQMVSNLVGNAIEHSLEATPITVTVDGEPGGVTLEVHNQNRSGPLLPEEVKTLFEPFRRGSQSSGLGLGLYIVRMIAQAHGGKVEARSDADGTTFRLHFPGHPR